MHEISVLVEHYKNIFADEIRILLSSSETCSSICEKSGFAGILHPACCLTEPKVAAAKPSLLWVISAMQVQRAIAPAAASSAPRPTPRWHGSHRRLATELLPADQPCSPGARAGHRAAAVGRAGAAEAAAARVPRCRRPSVDRRGTRSGGIS